MSTSTRRNNFTYPRGAVSRDSDSFTLPFRKFARVTVDVVLRATWWPIEIGLPRGVFELASELSMSERLRLLAIDAPQQSRRLLHERETFMPIGDSRFLVFCREIS